MVSKECLGKGYLLLDTWEKTKKVHDSLITDRNPDHLRFLANFKIFDEPTKGAVLRIADTLEKDDFDGALSQTMRLMDLVAYSMFDTVVKCECKPKK